MKLKSISVAATLAALILSSAPTNAQTTGTVALGVGKIWGSLICGMMVLLREDGHGCADLDGNNL